MKTDRTGDRQYAALVWRRAPELEILLITSRDTGRWVIPKGWPMADCTPSACAAQEALEEAGVQGHVSSRSLGSYVYDKRLKDGAFRPLTVEVYPLELVRELSAWPEASQRTRRWFPTAQAAGLVDEPGLSALITAFTGRPAPPRT